MFCRVVYTAKIGKDRSTREIGMSMNSKGELRLQFDRDIDWSEPIFVIIEPADSAPAKSVVETIKLGGIIPDSWEGVLKED